MQFESLIFAEQFVDILVIRSFLSKVATRQEDEMKEDEHFRRCPVTFFQKTTTKMTVFLDDGHALRYFMLRSHCGYTVGVINWDSEH